MTGVDKQRQRATKRRIKRERRNRRFGGWFFWGGVVAVLLVPTLFYANHYIFSRTEKDITVADTDVYSGTDGDTRYSVFATDGTQYYVEGIHRVREYEEIQPGRSYHCKVRGIDQEIPLWFDFHAQITNCEPRR